MRPLLPTIGTILLTLACLNAQAAAAQAEPPTTHPATAQPRTTGPTTAAATARATTDTADAAGSAPAEPIRSLVQLRIREGLLELYTDHPATKGRISVRLDQPPAKAQLKIAISSQTPPPYCPDVFELAIAQADAQGIINTTVSSIGGNVQLWRDATLPSKEATIVQLVQSPVPDADGGGIRLYIQRMVEDEEIGKANFPAADFSALIRQHLEPTDQYLRPIMETLGGQEQLFDVEPALAAAVFAGRLRPDADLLKTITALVSRLDADLPEDRNAAQVELEKLGQRGVAGLRAIDASKLSLEQQTRLRTILASHSLAAGVDPTKLRVNLHFLLDALNCSDAMARKAALDELRDQTHQAITLDLDGPEEPRRAKVRELRRQLTTPATSPATAPVVQEP